MKFKRFYKTCKSKNKRVWDFYSMYEDIFKYT